MTAAADARFWNRMARRYARAKLSDPEGYERTLERVRKLLTPESSVLELGCGTGSTALRLAGGVARYLATDISDGMIAIAEEKLAADPIRGLTFRVATAEEVATEDPVFDAVLGFNYLHMVRDTEGTLARIRDMLKPGGLFVTKTPCVREMNPLVGRALLPVLRAVRLAPHVAVFGAEELAERIGQAGFEIAAIERHGAKGREFRPFIVARKE
ncbi:class I SAM-dependent methyltransferase [Histidinibacterium lentulum]|uniref:Class I SAM-dependent methyltransferase n=1 Tax=Histidinibacterium lentulum TaxID=2480588 RepID=A0A3N2QYR8_9RHOB|nr:class I SAM-dependent methyltransferase [Histidinibacterium lentulum]ROU00351.1 class I SAM-dependent methyltransferase [Histidinibacterium lentulum]